MSSGGDGVQRADARLLTQTVHVARALNRQVVHDHPMLQLIAPVHARVQSASSIQTIISDDRRVMP